MLGVRFPPPAPVNKRGLGLRARLKWAHLAKKGEKKAPAEFAASVLFREKGTNEKQTVFAYKN